MSQNSCCVPGCAVARKDGVPLHWFPNPEKHAEKFKTWISNIGGEIAKLDHISVFDNKRVCHRHFEEINKYPSGRLSKLAIPTLNIPDLQAEGSLSGAMFMSTSDITQRNQLQESDFKSASLKLVETGTIPTHNQQQYCSAAMAAEGSGSEVRVRPATRADMPLVHRMISELASFEGVPQGPQLSVDDLIHDGFECSPAWFFVLMAEWRGEVVGHALCTRAYSSWTRRAFYVEDLYVRPRASRGVGRGLLRALCQMAMLEGVHRVDWHVLESNSRALAFYERLGARDLRRSEGRAALRLDRRHIRALAEGPPLAPGPPGPPLAPQCVPHADN